MRSVRLTIRPEGEIPHPMIETLAFSSYVDEARLVDWNFADPDAPVLLFVIEGDRERVTADFAAAPEVLEFEVTPVDDGTFVVYVRPEPNPPAQAVIEQLTGSGLVPSLPIVYRDGAGHVELVGSEAALQGVVEGLPSFVEVSVEEVGRFDDAPDAVLAVLSDRQREALLAAVELGYYDSPRRATHADVADALGCAASTASEHLQKAESKLVREVVRRERAG